MVPHRRGRHRRARPRNRVRRGPLGPVVDLRAGRYLASSRQGSRARAPSEGLDQLVATDLRRRHGQGRVVRHLDVFVHQLRANVPLLPRVVRPLQGRRARRDRRAFSRVRFREGARKCRRCGEAARRDLAGGARRRHDHLERVQEPVLARRLRRRSHRSPAVLALRRGRLRRTPKTCCARSSVWPRRRRAPIEA